MTLQYWTVSYAPVENNQEIKELDCPIRWTPGGQDWGRKGQQR